MYTEFFTEYVSSKGNTPLEVVQDWADDWGWDATINDVPTAAAQGALVAAAGDDEIDPQWDAEFEANLVEFDDDGYVFTAAGAADDGNVDTTTTGTRSSGSRTSGAMRKAEFAPKGYVAANGSRNARAERIAAAPRGRDPRSRHRAVDGIAGSSRTPTGSRMSSSCAMKACPTTSLVA